MNKNIIYKTWTWKYAILFKAQRNIKIKKLTKHIGIIYKSIQLKEFKDIFKTEEESTNNRPLPTQSTKISQPSVNHTKLLA